MSQHREAWQEEWLRGLRRTQVRLGLPVSPTEGGAEVSEVSEVSEVLGRPGPAELSGPGRSGRSEQVVAARTVGVPGIEQVVAGGSLAVPATRPARPPIKPPVSVQTGQRGSTVYGHGGAVEKVSEEEKRSRSVQVWGVWRDGPWCAARTSLLLPDGTRRRRAVYVLEVRTGLPGHVYETCEFAWRWHRDAYRWLVMHSRRWRKAEKFAIARRVMRSGR